MEIKVEATTKTQQLVEQLSWNTRPSGDGSNLAVESCPICAHRDYKFYIHVGGDKDGLWKCMVCGEKGNYWQLRERLGLRTSGLVSVHDMQSSGASPLPNPDVLHRRLMEDEKFGDVLDYLVSERRFSTDTIKRLKLGAEEYDGKLWYVIPYLDAAGKCVYFKARTIPPEKKAFRSPSGREAMLYNDTCLNPGMDELVMVEGEADAIALINQGFEHVVGVPGAGVQKAAWLEKLDRLAPKAIYLCYDTDKVGQEAACAMGARIGLDKVKNLLLPPFEVGGKAGKDANEFFASGHTLEEFRACIGKAKPFDVEGVKTVKDVLNDLKTQLEEKGAEPTYLTPWQSLTKRLGGCEDGDVIGVTAEGKVGKTTLGLNWCQWAAERSYPALMYCLEMLPVRLVRKWVSHITQTNDTPGASEITPIVVNDAMILSAQMTGDLLFGYSKSRKPEDVCETIRQAVRRYGVKLVCLDNLQLLVHNVKESSQETSRVSKMLKALAMELQIVLLLIVQPHRVPEGQIIAARNAAGSSAIEKDVDAMICLHRNRVAQIKAADFHGYLEAEDNFEPQLLCRVDLSRYSAGGTCTLWMDGAKSTVRELSHDELSSGTTPMPIGGIQTEEPIEV